MSKNKIIIIFIALIVVLSGGYAYINHSNKVKLAQYYYDIGEYQKSADLHVGDISKKASEAVSTEKELQIYIKGILENNK